MTKKKDSYFGQTAVELEKEEKSIRGQITKARIEMLARRLKNTNAVKMLRIKLARIMTAKKMNK